MDHLKKLFGDIEMTWFRVILLSIITAIITAIFLILPVFNNNALREMGVGYECWFIFAIFIVCNTKSAKEAGLKTFVFFLISQPLIYLIQQPFASINLLGTYYYHWFIMTLLTLPGGMIAYLIKKDQLYSAFILAVAGIYMAGFGLYTLIEHIFDFNLSYILYGIFFIVFTIALGFIIFNKKINRIIYLVIILIAVSGIGYYSLKSQFDSGVGSYDITHTGTWQIDSYNANNMNITMEDEDTIDYTFQGDASGEVYLSNEDGETIKVIITISNGEVTVEETDGN